MIIQNQTVFDIPLTWDRIRFESTRNKYRVARKLIETSINVQFEKQIRGVFSHNIEIDENITDINQRLVKYHDKLRVLDNMIELASQSLRIYFDKRMENVRAIVNEHCNIIQQIISEESEHWKEIHAVMDQNLLNPGDVRSRNNYPRTVQKSPASNIETIEEEDDDDDDEEHVSKLLNGKTLTPLLTQMIRKSRIQSKRLTIVPSIKIHIPIEQENSIPRKGEQFSMHILPISTTRQPLEIVDTTFVIKPEETIYDDNDDDNDGDDDEPNGTYRAPNQNYRLHLTVPQGERTLLDSQPNIPARLCFSPTILQDPTVSPEDNTNEQSLSSSDHEQNDERYKTIIVPIDRNQTNMKKPTDNPHHFGQTFLLDIVKTEQIDNNHNEYIRPTIPDDDVLVVLDTNSPPLKHILHPRNNNSASKSEPAIQQELITVQETVPVKSRTRTTTKTKSKAVIVSARKTRSATKVIAEQEAATAKISIEKPIENKRKTRKRKQSKSIDRPIDTSDDENPSTNSTHTITNKNKTKKHKRSKTDHHLHEITDDNNENLLSINNKRKTEKRRKSKRNDQQQDISNDNENTNNNSKRKTKKSQEQDVSDNENDKINSSRRKKTRILTNDHEEKPTKTKKRKPKIKKMKKDDEEQISKHSTTRSSSKRNHRSS